MSTAFRNRRSRGLSLVEMLVALSISALLLVAIMVALNASFYAYATAAESASTQSCSRLVMQRTLQLIRTATLHDAYDPADASVTLAEPGAAPVQCVGIQMVNPAGQLLKIWWTVNATYHDTNLGDLQYSVAGGAATPLLERVHCQRTAQNKPYIFTLASKDSDSGLLLSRATLDITVDCGADATLALEDVRGAAAPIRLVASTDPRKNLE